MEIQKGGLEGAIPGSRDVLAIGAAAWEALEPDQEAKILGWSSRGAYLACPTGKVVFLSTEKHRGPLTLNLSQTALHGEDLPPGHPVQVRSQSLYLSSKRGMISFQNAPVWRPAPPDLNRLERSGLGERLERLVELVLDGRRAGSASLLAETAAAAWERFNGTGAPDRQEWKWGDLRQLTSALEGFLKASGSAVDRREAAKEGLTEAAIRFLGRGRGLTPSGDDLILGLALTLARWNNMVEPGVRASEDLSAWLPALAARKTTSISAGLIASACQGQADERLIFALDGLMTGGSNLIECARGFLSWGSTSGCDVLAGILLAVSTISRVLPAAAEAA